MRVLAWTVVAALLGIALVIWLRGAGTDGARQIDLEPATDRERPEHADGTAGKRRGRRRANAGADSDDRVDPVARAIECAAAHRRRHRDEHRTLVPLEWYAGPQMSELRSR